LDLLVAIGIFRDYNNSLITLHFCIEEPKWCGRSVQFFGIDLCEKVFIIRYAVVVCGAVMAVDADDIPTGD